MIDKINALKARIEGLTAANEAEVEALRVAYLSKKGEVSLLFNDFRTVPADQKKAIGQALNELKNFATERINALRDAMASADTGLDGIDPDPHSGSHASGHASPAVARARGNHRHIPPSGLHGGRRSGN